jgi:predicted transcriptional regulator
MFIKNETAEWFVMPKTLTMRLDDATYETFSRAALAERRSLANLIETAALQQIQERQFADDAEMAEILARPELVRRLKKGAADAKKRKGRFVSGSL